MKIFDVCKNGHVFDGNRAGLSPFYIEGTYLRCKECKKKYNGKYYKKNRRKILKRSMERYIRGAK